MVITGLLLPVVAIERWKWPIWCVAIGGLVFATIDLSFVGGNLSRCPQGGWLPLVIGAVIFTLMTTWKTGRRLVAERLTARALPLEEFMSQVRNAPPVRVSGTAVFMTAQPRGTPPALLHNVRYNKVLHENVDRVDRVDGAGAARVTRGSTHHRTPRRWRVRRPREATASWKIRSCPTHWTKCVTGACTWISRT